MVIRDKGLKNDRRKNMKYFLNEYTNSHMYVPAKFCFWLIWNLLFKHIHIWSTNKHNVYTTVAFNKIIMYCYSIIIISMM